MYSHDKMEFCREKYSMFVMKSGNDITDGMEVRTQDKIRTLGEKGNL